MVLDHNKSLARLVCHPHRLLRQGEQGQVPLCSRDTPPLSWRLVSHERRQPVADRYMWRGDHSVTQNALILQLLGGGASPPRPPARALHPAPSLGAQPLRLSLQHDLLDPPLGQANFRRFKKHNFPVTAKIRTSGYQTLECLLQHSQLRKRMGVLWKVKKVTFPHTRYRALGPELIPVYRQSARRWREVNHAIYPAVVCHCFLSNGKKQRTDKI